MWSTSNGRDALALTSDAYELVHAEGSHPAVVLLHALEGSPGQMSLLARSLFARGWNVVVPQLPFHGTVDRAIRRYSLIDTENLFDCAERAVVRARTLGRTTTLAGFSLGGAVALWVGHRTQVDRVVAIAPFLGYRYLPTPFNAFVGEVLARVPLIPLRYNRFVRREIGRILAQNARFLEQVWKMPPKTRHLVIGLNTHERTVNNEAAREIGEAWAAHRTACVDFREIRGLPPSHDIVDLRPENGLIAQQALPYVMRLFDESP